MALRKIRPDGIELDSHRHRFLLAQDIELNIVTFEFTLDDFRHLNTLAFQFDERVACDWMIVNGQQDIALLECLGGGTGGDDCRYDYSASIVLQSVKATLRWILQFRVAQTQINILIIMSILEIG